MLYIQKGEENILVLNIVNNTRNSFNYYNLLFTHIMSKEMKTYTIYTNDPTQFTDNERYCSITLSLNTDDLNYEGQYQLDIYGDGTDIVYTGITILEGQAENQPFTQYVSDNEINENYIYIQE